MVWVARGDERALAALVDRHAANLQGFLTRMTGNQTEAEDLMQDTWVRIARAARSFDPARKFRSWAYSIALNLARDARRHKLVRARAPVDPPREPHDPISLDTIDVRSRISALPERLREVLVLRYFEGMGEVEMAEALQVPRGTVKSRLHTAIGALKRSFGENH